MRELFILLCFTEFRPGTVQEAIASKLKMYGEGTLSTTSSQVGDSTAQDTDTESHLSSNMGAWGDDPDIQQKVK